MRYRSGDAAGDSELDHILRSFEPRSAGARGRSRRPGLGEALDQGQGLDPNVLGLSPGLIAESSAARGSISAQGLRRLTGPAQGPDQPAVRLDPSSLDSMSRMLEQTFRNFQLHARPPSHIAPPFTAKPIDAFANGVVAIANGAPGAFVDVASFVVPKGAYRAEVTALGQSAESQLAWNDLEWRVTVDGIAFQPWDSVKIQLWQMMPVTPLSAPIHLTGGQTVKIQARTLANLGPHSVLGRIFGWWYPTRAELGNLIGSTLVD